MEAIQTFEANPDRFDPKVIRAHAETFSTNAFKAKFKDAVDRFCA